MGVDYYKVLGLSRSATVEEIRKAYYKIAQECHPSNALQRGGHRQTLSDAEKYITHLQDGQAKFCLVAEAYDVLSNDIWRRTFNEFGEEGLKNGPPNIPQGSDFPKYSFCKSPRTMYREMMGTTYGCASEHHMWQRENPRRRPDGHQGPWFRQPPLEVVLELSLEEVYIGGLKIVDIHRNEESGEVTHSSLEVTFSPGVEDGTTYTFPGQGHREPFSIPGDVIVVVRSLPHPVFSREGSSTLVYVARMNLIQALLGCILKLESLDGRVLRVRLTDVIATEYEICVPGEGLPIPPCTNSKDHDLSKVLSSVSAASVEGNEPDILGFKSCGDLIIRFNVVFPREIPADCRKALVDAMEEME